MATQRTAWNQVSEAYNSLHESNNSLIHVATREVLALLGSAAGLDVLEIGCGSGQNCVEMAHRGARVTGVEISDAQIALARQSVESAGVAVHLLRADAADLSPLPDASFDAILAIYVFPYVTEMTACLAECARLLRPGGRLLFAQDHPIRACFWDAEMQEESVLPARSYFDHTPLRWNFMGTDTAMTSFHRPLAQWLLWLHENNFAVQTLQELPLPDGWADDPDTDEYTREIARFLPQILVIEAIKK